MSRSLGSVVIALALCACAASPELETPPASRPLAGGPPGWRNPDAVIEADALRVLGPVALAEVEAAPQAVLVRGLASFPRMIQQPDGSWQAEPPMMAAAVRGPSGWTRITREERSSLPSVVGRQLDRLLSDAALWSEADTPAGACTDPSGILVRVKATGRKKTSAHPCGFAGVAGRLGEIVLAGEITDWRGVPMAERPAGLVLRRFDEETASLFRYASGITDERRLDIRSGSEWEAQWARLTAGHGPRRPPPAVDFTREMVLVAAMGTRSSGGYQVVIDRVLETPAGLEAHVRHLSPGRTCGAAAALSRPADVVIVPASPHPVHWVVDADTSDCG